MTLESEWVSARDAVHRIMRATGLGASGSLDAVVAYVRTGDIKARALVLTEDTHRQGAGKQTQEMRDAPVPVWFWGDFTTRGSANFNWQSGVFTGHGFRGSNQMTVTLTGIQFDAHGLQVLDPAPQPARAGAGPGAVGISGRPPAGWWEDLIIDVFAKIYWGDLKPERQSHIEVAMQEWISTKGLSAPSSTVRKRARKLWNALHRQGES